MLNCIIRKRNYLLLIPTFDQTLCVLFQCHFRLGLTKVFVWLYTGHVLCGNETQGLLLCSLPFAACYSPGTKPPCFTESRRCTGTRHKTKETTFFKINDVSRLSVVLFQCTPSFQHGGFLPRE